jgi:hypothetical protein
MRRHSYADAPPQLRRCAPEVPKGRSQSHHACEANPMVAPDRHQEGSGPFAKEFREMSQPGALGVREIRNTRFPMAGNDTRQGADGRARVRVSAVSPSPRRIELGGESDRPALKSPSNQQKYRQSQLVDSRRVEKMSPNG